MQNLLDFRNKLSVWFSVNKRELPWRETDDPYAIWLSEIIMQQTRINQGLSYYLKFIQNYPTVIKLAHAPEDDILKLWQGLGYYSRVRNLHHTAKIISSNFNGKFPDTYGELIKLKGIGEYTAAAIASIAFNQPHAVVDGNVYRFLSRLYGIETPIDTTIGKNEFKKLANKLIDIKNPGEHNQAMMEFGSLQCLPKNPNCESCPFQKKCIAFTSNLTNKLPVKQGKTKVRKRYFNYLIIIDGNHTYINKRTQEDIWKNLFDFPSIETSKKDSLKELCLPIQERTGFEDIILKEVTSWQKHILSHQQIHYRFIYIIGTIQKNKLVNLIKVNKKDIFDFAVPRLIDKELKKDFWNKNEFI